MKEKWMQNDDVIKDIKVVEQRLKIVREVKKLMKQAGKNTKILIGDFKNIQEEISNLYKYFSDNKIKRKQELKEKEKAKEEEKEALRKFKKLMSQYTEEGCVIRKLPELLEKHKGAVEIFKKDYVLFHIIYSIFSPGYAEEYKDLKKCLQKPIEISLDSKGDFGEMLQQCDKSAKNKIKTYNTEFSSKKILEPVIQKIIKNRGNFEDSKLEEDGLNYYRGDWQKEIFECFANQQKKLRNDIKEIIEVDTDSFKKTTVHENIASRMVRDINIFICAVVYILNSDENNKKEVLEGFRSFLCGFAMFIKEYQKRHPELQKLNEWNQFCKNYLNQKNEE